MKTISENANENTVNKAAADKVNSTVHGWNKRFCPWLEILYCYRCPARGVRGNSCKRCNRRVAIRKTWSERAGSTKIRTHLQYIFRCISIIFHCNIEFLLNSFSKDLKTSKPQNKTTEVEVKPKENSSSIVAKINPSLYKKLIIEDLTSTGMGLLQA